MPNSVTSVGSSAFNNCTALAYVYYGGKEGDITIGSNNTHLTDATWHYAGCTHTDKAVSGYVAPTCTEEGYTYAVVCAVCGVVKEARDPIPATGHAYGGDNLCNACGKDKYAEYYTYTVSNGNATITGITDISLSGELVLPSTLGGYPVTEIGSTAFENCTWLTSVTIPDSVTTINYGAFYNCTALDSVTIGSRVTSIAGTVFRRCLSLKDVYYRGSEADRANITIGSYNDLLTDAMWHYVGTDDATLGDVDGSGSVDSTDARVTLQYAVQKIDGATLNLTAADVDGSGHVDSTDARIILQYAVRKIDKLPAA